MTKIKLTQPLPTGNDGSASNSHLSDLYRSRSRNMRADDETSPWSLGGSTNVSIYDGFQEDASPRGLARYFQADIDTKWTDVILIVCGFVSGLVDGLSFNAWGSFSSMQTGNTVFIALGISGQPTYPAYLWAKSLIALLVFIVGNLFFIHVSRLLGPLRRSTLILSFSLQTACLMAAALVVQLNLVSPRPEDPRAPIEWNQILPISLMAFQAAGQICSSRILAFDEIPTVVLTTLLCDLLVDTNLYRRPWSANPKRNRRAAAFLALFLGAATAGGLTKVTQMASSLWLAVALKGSITVLWFVWREKKPVTAVATGVSFGRSRTKDEDSAV